MSQVVKHKKTAGPQDHVLRCIPFESPAVNLLAKRKHNLTDLQFTGFAAASLLPQKVLK
jgi:hypothetical protein